MRLDASLADTVIDGINSVLAESGVIDPELEDITPEEELSHVQKVFKQRGAGIESAASRVADLMNSEKPEIALRATEICLKANAVYADVEKKKTVPQITINIMGSGENQNTLVNLVMPSPAA